MSHLILLRHGRSMWNELNLFTGWVDVPLNENGIQEATKAGKKISKLPIDIIYCSSLIRAQMTAMIALSYHSSAKVPVIMHSEGGKMEAWGNYDPKFSQTIPVYCHWELNERMYGDLQGLDKDETRKKFGEEQVKIWRRSYDVRPPNGESLKDTAARCLPFFDKIILPHLKNGKNILISAHGNSLRSIIMELDQLSTEEVLHLEIPTGDPILYDFADGKFQKKNII